MIYGRSGFGKAYARARARDKQGGFGCKIDSAAITFAASDQSTFIKEDPELSKEGCCASLWCLAGPYPGFVAAEAPGIRQIIRGTEGMNRLSLSFCRALSYL